MARRKRKGRPGLGYLLCWNGRLRWWLRIYLSGWLGTSDACGRSPWHAGSGRPPESAQKRGTFQREHLPHFTPDLTRRTRPGPTKATRGGHPPPHGNATDERRDLPRTRQARAPSWNVTPGHNSATLPSLVAASSPRPEPYQPTDPGPTRPQNRNNAHGLAVDQRRTGPMATRTVNPTPEPTHPPALSSMPRHRGSRHTTRRSRPTVGTRAGAAAGLSGPSCWRHAVVAVAVGGEVAGSTSSP